jgi:hypothetical protein
VFNFVRPRGSAIGATSSICYLGLGPWLGRVDTKELIVLGSVGQFILPRRSCGRVVLSKKPSLLRDALGWPKSKPYQQ